MTRMMRIAAAMVAVLIGSLALAANPAAAQDSTPVASPGAEQPVTIGETEVTWTGGWEVSGDVSEEQVVLARNDAATGTIIIATYSQLVDDTVDTPEAALDTFAASFVEESGAVGAVEGGAGELEDGTVWKAYAFELMGIPLRFLITVTETADGEYVLSTLTGTVAGFQGAIEAAQADIMLNGEPIFLDGIDAADVVAGLDAAPEATPPS